MFSKAIKFYTDVYLRQRKGGKQRVFKTSFTSVKKK